MTDDTILEITKNVCFTVAFIAFLNGFNLSWLVGLFRRRQDNKPCDHQQKLQALEIVINNMMQTGTPETKNYCKMMLDIINQEEQ